MNDVTNILSAIEQGDHRAAEQLLPLVYDELRELAAARLADEKSGQTLQPTALVHEAYLRLVGGQDAPNWNGRGHFFAAAAEAMRRILLDHARARGRVKRGGGGVRLSEVGDVAALAEADPEQIVAVDDAVRRLEGEDPEAAAMVRLRFYAGLSVDQAAEALGISARTAARLWTYARALLFRNLGAGP